MVTVDTDRAAAAGSGRVPLTAGPRRQIIRSLTDHKYFSLYKYFTAASLNTFTGNIFTIIILLHYVKIPKFSPTHSTPGAGVTGHLRKFSESVTVSHKVFGRGAGPASALLWRLSDTEPWDTDRGPLLIYTSAFLGRPILETRERDTAMMSSYRRAEYHFILTAKDGNTVRDELTPGFPEGRSSSNKF